MRSTSSSYEKIYAVVRKIPRGKVATYGQIATLAGLSGAARQVGYALHAIPGDGDIPWHRVINARGKISPRSAGDNHNQQRMRLEHEGVRFGRNDRIEMHRFQWDP